MSMIAANAANAYAQAAGRLVSNGAGADGAGEAPAAGSSFADLMKGMLSDAASTGKAAEATAAASLAGKAELVDVVTAISAAETSLETVIAVRDKVISAYQEISKMPI